MLLIKRWGVKMYVIYLDILFAINWYMDTLIFYCVTLILNHPIKILRIIWAGLIASLLYCMLILCHILQLIPYSIYSLLVPIIAILYLYKPKSIKGFVKLYLLCTLVAAVFGGIIFNVWFTFNHDIRGIHSMELGMLFLIGGLTMLCFDRGFYFIRRRLIFPAFEYGLTLKNRNQCIKVKALLDTGNLLYTPIKHEPVVVVEYESIKHLLSKEQMIQFENYRRSNSTNIEEALLNGTYQPDVLIPFNSVGCKEGYLWGVRIDQILIKERTGEKEFSSCVIGISGEHLFSDQQYHALLHPEFILEEVVAL